MSNTDLGFPKTLFVTKEEAGSEDEFLQPFEDIDLAAVVGEEITVAVYEFKEVKTLITKIEFKS